MLKKHVVLFVIFVAVSSNLISSSSGNRKKSEFIDKLAPLVVGVAHWSKDSLIEVYCPGTPEGCCEELSPSRNSPDKAIASSYKDGRVCIQGMSLSRSCSESSIVTIHPVIVENVPDAKGYVLVTRKDGSRSLLTRDNAEAEMNTTVRALVLHSKEQ